MKKKRYNLNVRIDEDIMKMIKFLRDHHSLNLSSFVKRKIKEEYDKLNK